MKVKKLNTFILYGSLALTLTACGGSGGGTEEEVLKGIFVDSPVSGLDYMTDSRSGKTNESGEFEYLEGETVTFMLGDLTLGSAPGASEITNFDIGDSLEDRNPNTNPIYPYLKIATLLQSLDNNENPADGINLGGMVTDTNGIDITDGITQDMLDLISGEENKAALRSESDVFAHTTVSLYNSMEEKNGMLVMNNEIMQEDVDAGKYRIDNRFGRRIYDPVTENLIINSEADLTLLSHENEDQSRIRNIIAFIGTEVEYYMGVGMRYRASTGAYHWNYFVEKVNKTTGISTITQPTILPEFENITFDVNQTRNFKIEFNQAEKVANAYLDGEKVLTWDVEMTESFDYISAYINPRVQAVRDETTGAAIAPGSKMSSTADNFKVIVNGEVLVDDDFEDGILENENINYFRRTR